MSGVPSDLAQALRRMRSGESLDLDELLPLVYGQLRGMARGFMAGEGKRHTLQPTALVHEAYLKLRRAPRVDWDGRVHFFRLVGRAMRQVLVDHARTAKREKRGGGWLRQPLDEGLAVAGASSDPIDLIALDDALGKLCEQDARKAQVVELRYFLGFTTAQCAQALDVVERTVERDWAYAQAWLARELGRSG
ncbi:MAG: ECF-type sigma factor [Planctomycetota bacterium]|nr:ECF-type sigma factor [Planctomycetota bacterium]